MLLLQFFLHCWRFEGMVASSCPRIKLDPYLLFRPELHELPAERVSSSREAVVMVHEV